MNSKNGIYSSENVNASITHINQVHIDVKNIR